MRQRAKLFDDFTNGLDGLTIKQKKDAVANLKRLLSSKVSFIHYLRTTGEKIIPDYWLSITRHQFIYSVA